MATAVASCASHLRFRNWRARERRDTSIFDAYDRLAAISTKFDPSQMIDRMPRNAIPAISSMAARVVPLSITAMPRARAPSRRTASTVQELSVP
jgi:hypothetical protein